MTITYSKEVATASFSCFLKLLARWRGSIYKLLWKDFFIFAFCYFALSFVYRFVMNENQKKIFEMIAKYCEGNHARIPLAFILGFYVSLIMTRWWNQLALIPWPDHIAMFVTANVGGSDERGIIIRRTMVRHTCLAFTMTMSCISPAVRKRFPTIDHFVDAGIMTANERDVLNKMPDKYGTFFIPLVWITKLANEARSDGRIRDDFALKTIIDEINEVRRCLATLTVYDWISVPLVYTQVVTWAVYSFFLASLMGTQFTDSNKDVYLPFFSFLEYFFYMGWLKVAECMVNPFGEDEDDFDVNFLIDRNLCVAYTIVDDAQRIQPTTTKDMYWGGSTFDLPYTAASEQFRIIQPFKGSAVNLTLSAKDKEFLPPPNMEVIDELEEVFHPDERTHFHKRSTSKPSVQSGRQMRGTSRRHRSSHSEDVLFEMELNDRKPEASSPSTSCQQPQQLPHDIQFIPETATSDSLISPDSLSSAWVLAPSSLDAKKC